MLLNSAPTVDQYNRVKLFENQVHFVDQRHLLRVGQIYVRHGMHTKFDIGLLHRHSQLQPGHLMLHSRQGANINTCKMTSLDACASVDIAPCSYNLNSDYLFQPLDYYEGVNTNNPPEEFLRDIRTYLCDHDLDDIICLLVGEMHGTFWREYQLPDGTGTVSYGCKEEQIYNYNEGGVVTSWNITLLNGEIKIRARQVCDPRPKGGGHLIKD